MSYNPDNPRPLITNTTNFNSNYSQKPRIQITFPPDSLYTKQEFRDECDINVLMARYQSTGELPVINQSAPQYLDVTGIQFQESMNFIAGAQTLFQELPSAIRSRFQNDPAQFLDFCSKESNRAEMHEMGLLRPDYVPPAPAVSTEQQIASQAKSEAPTPILSSSPSAS